VGLLGKDVCLTCSHFSTSQLLELPEKQVWCLLSRAWQQCGQREQENGERQLVGVRRNAHPNHGQIFEVSEQLFFHVLNAGVL
jgi:hypothetical protein